MDSNGFDLNHIDVDVRLPPRKRLLAGLRKQSCSESFSQCSPEKNLSPNSSSSIDQNPLSEFDIRLTNLLKSYKNGSNMSPEEIALAAKSAAEAAAKAAKAARAVAEEKAAIASKAVEAAKNALNLVAYEEKSCGLHKKNKLKKHVPVMLLYNEYQPIDKFGKDEEYAMRLHRAMNSLPRIGKHSPGSESRTRKLKKLRIHSPNDKRGISNGSIMRNKDAKFSNGDLEGGLDYEGCNEKVSGSSEDEGVEMDSSEVESIYPKKRSCEEFDDLCCNGKTRKRGRIKQSRGSSKDKANPKEESDLTNSLTRGRMDDSTAPRLSSVSMEPSSDSVTLIEAAPTWKCQDFKVSQCIKQDKLVQS